jgi:hypothetical protein
VDLSSSSNDTDIHCSSDYHSSSLCSFCMFTAQILKRRASHHHVYLEEIPVFKYVLLYCVLSCSVGEQTKTKLQCVLVFAYRQTFLCLSFFDLTMESPQALQSRRTCFVTRSVIFRGLYFLLESSLWLLAGLTMNGEWHFSQENGFPLGPISGIFVAETENCQVILSITSFLDFEHCLIF